MVITNLLLSASLVLLAACTRTASAPAPDAATPDGDGAERRLEGILRHDPALAAVKSVDAYLGREITLATDEGEVVLATSAAVSSDAVRALAGTRVVVVCRMVPQPPPDRNESFPMGPDGAPLARPARCEVSALAPAP